MSNPMIRFWAGRGLALKVILSLIFLVIAYAIAAPAFEIGGVSGLKTPPVVASRIDQGWSEKISDMHHYTSQGTKILPLSWFLALEQPVATVLPVGRYASRDYLARFGFNYTRKPPAGDDPDPNDPDLPVGFAVEKNFVAAYAEPPIEEPIRVVGLTCAACHTGRLDLKLGAGQYKPILIDGGSAMINLSAYQQATGLALFYTQFPIRFDRFAREVIRLEQLLSGKTGPVGRDEEEKQKVQLKSDLTAYVNLGLASQDYAKEHKLNPIDAGFARTDALGLIGNRVFGVLNVENQIVTDAPVNFPHLWDTAWFDWVQYNASIRTPMARNIGEALGVGALVNLTSKKAKLYDSTVNVQGLAIMEEWLGGDKPFGGLQPPRWDNMIARAFGKDSKEYREHALNSDRVEAGAKLYQKHCAACHLPPRKDLEADLAGKSPRYFTEPDPWSGRRFLKLNVVDLSVIGTDPNQALNFYRRVAVASEPPWTRNPSGEYRYESNWINQGVKSETWSATISAEEGLFRVTSFVRANNYQSPPLSLLAPPIEGNPATMTPEERAKKSEAAKRFNNDPARLATRMKYDRYRGVPEVLDFVDQDAVLGGQDMDWVIKDNLGYKARPLDGIWATPPYLHNGSVPNLEELLSPVADRQAKFYLGSTRFDPTDVGFETDRIAGATLMDTSLPGNRNEGHEFRDLRLEELENFVPPHKEWTNSQRWAIVLKIDANQYESMSASDRKALVHKASIEELEKPRTKVIRGLLGPAFGDDDRKNLIEYLKSI